MVDSPAHFGRTVWALTYAPAIWAAHFLVSYCTAAVFCAKAAWGEPLDPVRAAVAVATVIALGGIGYVWVQAWRRWTSGRAHRPLDPTPEGLGRDRFLAYATFLLAGLSALGTVYAALPVLFITVCDG